MGQVLSRATSLLWRPAVLLAGLTIAVGGCALTLLPLFDVPGYELSAAVAAGVGILGGIPAIAAGFQERRLLQGRDPRPRRALRQDDPMAAVLLATLAATTANAAFALPPFIFATVRALLTTRCDPFAHAGFYPLLVLPSALIAGAVGVFCGLAVRRAIPSALLYLLMLLGSAALTAWPLVRGPQIFAFNHFGGYVPGPLYDEALAITPALGWFRLETVLIAGAFIALTALLLDVRSGYLERPHLRVVATGLFIVCGLGIAALEDSAPELGFRMTRGALEEKLGGSRKTEHFLLFYPRGKPKLEVDRLERDLEFRHAQLSAFLGGAPQEPIRVYLYRSAQEKQALVGAAATQFAKPWLLETHVHDSSFPAGSLKHELVHLMAAPFGSGPLRVTSRYGLWPVMGIVEGMAVAGDNPVDDLTLHQWAAGMRQQGLAPDIRQVLGPSGFYQSSASRAYTLVGSFLRYLADTYGPQKLTALYAKGDFQGVYNRTLDGLATEWEKHLDGVPLDPAAVNTAFARFRQPSLFARACAREVATAHAVASAALQYDPERALELYERCATLQPAEPAFALGQASALARMERKADAAQVLIELANRVKEQPALAAEVALAQADLAVQRGKLEDARGILGRLLELGPSPAIERTARARLAGVNSPAAGPALAAYFQPGQEDVKLLVLREALARDPKNPYLTYLLGRRLTPLVPRLALDYLSLALQAELPDSVRRETYRLRVEAFYLAGDCAGARAEVGQLPDLGAAFKARAAQWVERCDFEDRAYKGPLVPEGPFR